MNGVSETNTLTPFLLLWFFISKIVKPWLFWAEVPLACSLVSRRDDSMTADSCHRNRKKTVDKQLSLGYT